MFGTQYLVTKPLQYHPGTDPPSHRRGVVARLAFSRQRILLWRTCRLVECSTTLDGGRHLGPSETATESRRLRHGSDKSLHGDVDGDHARVGALIAGTGTTVPRHDRRESVLTREHRQRWDP